MESFSLEKKICLVTIIASTVILGCVLLFVMCYAWWPIKLLPTPIASKPVIFNTLPDGYDVNIVSSQKLPIGFPKYLLLFDQAKIAGGENTIDGQGDNHKIVVALLSDKPEDIIASYQKTLESKNWIIQNQSQQGQLRVLLAYKDDFSFSVITTPKTNNTFQIELDYIIKKKK